MEATDIWNSPWGVEAEISALVIVLLTAEKAGLPHLALERGEVGLRERRGARVLPEEVFRHLVDLLVGALRRKHCRHKKLERVLVVEHAPRVRVFPAQDRRNFPRARLQIHVPPPTVSSCPAQSIAGCIRDTPD